MLPSEMIILMAVAVNKNAGKQLLTRPMDIASEYIGYLYDSLVNRGFLKGHKSAGYRLTKTGRESVAEFMRNNSSRAKDIAIRLKLLGIDINPEEQQKLGKLEGMKPG